MRWDLVRLGMEARIRDEAVELDERLFASVDEVVISMADAVCDMSNGLSVEAWHECLEGLVVILTERVEGFDYRAWREAGR